MELKVLISVHQFFPDFSAGTEVLTLNTAKELISRGYKVEIVTMRHTSKPKPYLDGGLVLSQHDGINIWELDYDFYKSVDPITDEFNNPYMSEMMRYLLDKVNPDIIHIMHTFRFSSSVINAYCERHIPVVITATDFWFVCPKIQLRTPEGGNCNGPVHGGANCVRCFSRYYNKTVSSILNVTPLWLIESAAHIAVKCGGLRYNSIKFVDYLFRRPTFLMNQMNRVGKVIVPTEIMKDILVQNGLDSVRTVKLHFGLDLSPFKDCCNIKRSSGKVVFAYIGTIVEHKGVHILAEAFLMLKNRHENSELLIYGDLSTYPEYADEVRSLVSGYDGVRFMGTFPNSEIGRVFTNFDVLVVPSIWYENTPLVVFSSMAAKTPVIATDMGGLTEVIKHGENGLVFKKGDAVGLCEQMSRFCDEPCLLESLSLGISPVESIEGNVHELEKIYESLLK